MTKHTTLRRYSSSLKQTVSLSSSANKRAVGMSHKPCQRNQHRSARSINSTNCTFRAATAETHKSSFTSTLAAARVLTSAKQSTKKRCPCRQDVQHSPFLSRNPALFRKTLSSRYTTQLSSCGRFLKPPHKEYTHMDLHTSDSNR